MKKNNVVLEHLDTFNSVSVGLCFLHGSIYEDSQSKGYSHFFEHMLLKRTKNFNSKEISLMIESVGGEINAFTSRNLILLYIKIPYFAINKAINLLYEIKENLVFNENDIEIEKDIVIEEIRDSIDEPDSYLYDKYMAHFFKGTCLEYPILGTVESIKNLTKEKIETFKEKIFYKTPSLISISGNLKALNQESKEIINNLVSNKVEKKKIELPIIPEEKLEITNFVQSHTLVGFVIKDISDIKKRIFLHFINTIFFEGLSSVFFQELREKEGLVYEVYPIIEAIEDNVVFLIYFSSSKINRKKVIHLIKKIFYNYYKRGFKQEELNFYKNFYKGNLLLYLENTYNRMYLNLKEKIIYDRVIPVEEKINLVENLTLDEINNFYRQYFYIEEFSIFSLIPRVKNDN